MAAPMTADMTMTSFDIGVDVLAVLIALVAIVLVIRLNSKLGGKLRSALRYFVLGILVNAFAMVWTAFFGHTYALGTVTFDVHNTFMAIGMVLFSLSAYRFSLLIPRD